MDDDKKLKAEFPLGDLKIVVAEPSEGQFFALALSRMNSADDRERTVRRLLKVLEKLTGPEQWYGVIEDAVIEGTVTPEQLLKLGEAVLAFPWKEHHAPAGVPVSEPEPVPDNAAPRIISGG